MSKTLGPKSILPQASFSQIEKLMKAMLRFRTPVTKIELCEALSKSRVSNELNLASKLGLIMRLDRNKYELTSKGNDLLSLPESNPRRSEILRIIIAENFPHLIGELTLKDQIDDSDLLEPIRFARNGNISEENARQCAKRLRSFLREANVIGNRTRVNNTTKWEVLCRKCPKCHYLAFKDKKFCLNCGNYLIQKKMVSITCLACGAANPEFARFCESCGSPITSKK